MESKRKSNAMFFGLRLTFFISSFVLMSTVGLSQAKHDSASLGRSVIGGHFFGEQRTYFMGTVNKDSLTDYTTVSLGGYLGYQTKWYKGWRIRGAYYTSWNTGLGNVWEQDQTTGKFSRYETGNYDITDSSNTIVHGLGELTLEYQSAKNRLTVGRFKRFTPLLNHQDGRMIPTLFQGIWYQRNGKKTSGDLALINGVWTRSTGSWNTPGNSLLYPQGRSVYGGQSNYIGNTSSDFIALGHLNSKIHKKVTVDLWNVFADHLMNTAYLETKFHWQKEKVKHHLAGQYIRQDRVGNGGNDSLQMQFFQNASSNTFGLQYSYQRSGYTLMLNGNRITDDGRYAFPREWGREFLYTFQKRERLEGVQDAWAWSAQVKKKYILKSKDELVAMLGYGMYFRPDPTDAVRNRVAMPSNSQLNLDVFYHFKKSVPGLRLEALIAYKGDLGEDWQNPNFIINRVDMVNYQLILNYKF